MMKRNDLLLVLMLLLTGCASNVAQRIYVTTTGQAPGETKTSERVNTASAPVVHDLHLTPTVQNTVMPVDAKVQKRCANFTTDVLAASPMKGIVVLGKMMDSKYSYAIDLASGNKILLSDQWLGSDWLPSPDKQLWLHTWLSKDPQGVSQVAQEVVSADGSKRIPLNLESGWEIRGWLNHQDLILDKQVDPVLAVYNTRIESPMLGLRKDLLFDYPDIYTPFEPLAYHPNVYNAALDRVMYPATLVNDQGRDEKGFVLRDTPQQKNIAFLSSYVGVEPKWSPDGEQLIVAGDPGGGENQAGLAFFQVTQDGVIKQLTQLSSIYKQANPKNFSWSPDGSQIAFWIADAATPDESEQLAVLDIQTETVTLFCIPGLGIGSSPPPIWSSNGKQVLVQMRNKLEADEAVVLDIENATAIILDANMQPFFWLSELPVIWSGYRTED